MGKKQQLTYVSSLNIDAHVFNKS